MSLNVKTNTKTCTTPTTPTTPIPTPPNLLNSPSHLFKHASPLPNCTSQPPLSPPFPLLGKGQLISLVLLRPQHSSASWMARMAGALWEE